MVRTVFSNNFADFPDSKQGRIQEFLIGGSRGFTEVDGSSYY